LIPPIGTLALSSAENAIPTIASLLTQYVPLLSGNGKSQMMINI